MWDELLVSWLILAWHFHVSGASLLLHVVSHSLAGQSRLVHMAALQDSKGESWKARPLWCLGLLLGHHFTAFFGPKQVTGPTAIQGVGREIQGTVKNWGHFCCRPFFTYAFFLPRGSWRRWIFFFLTKPTYLMMLSDDKILQESHLFLCSEVTGHLSVTLVLTLLSSLTTRTHLCSPLQLHKDPIVCKWSLFLPSPLTFPGRKGPVACTLLVQAVDIIFFTLLHISMWCTAFSCCLDLYRWVTITLLEFWSWGAESQLLVAGPRAGRKHG